MKKRMKQLAALSMAALMAASLAACGSSGGSSDGHQILQARAETTKKSCIGTSEQNHRIKMLLIKQ